MADLNSIIRELDASYNPARQSINDRINGLAGSETAQLQGLEATQRDAFDSITNNARSRGLGFSGIPIAEQARYTASSFLPAVANVKAATTNSRNSLIDALNNLNIDQAKTGQSLYQTALDREFQAEQARLQREAQERASRQAAAATAGILPGGGVSASAGGGVTKAQPNTAQQYQAAYNDVKNALASNDQARIQREYQAIVKSAGYGNVYDQQKKAVFEQLYPTVLKYGQNAQVGNVNVGVARPTQTVTVAKPAATQRLTVR